MKKIGTLILLVSFLISCKTDKENKKNLAYTSIGKEIIADDALSAERMNEHYKGMSVGDTINSKMTATVEEVCQAKGCWMKLKLDDGEQVMVKFKDYGFFMPIDITGKEVIVNGIAFVDEMSVDDQKHYAQDGGESTDVIDAITEPKKTYSFEADGVLLKN